MEIKPAMLVQSVLSGLILFAIIYVASGVQSAQNDIVRLQEQVATINANVTRNAAETGEWRAEIRQVMADTETRMRAVETIRRSPYGDMGGSGLRP